MKLFGGGRATSSQFADDLRLLLNLDSQKRAGFARLFQDMPNLYPNSTADLAPLASELQMDRNELGRMIAMTRFVLHRWSISDLSEADLRTDFLETKFEESESEVLVEFFRSVAGTRDKVRRAALKRAYEQLGLPTVDDINLVWDIRPMFEEAAYTLSPKANEYETLVGKAYVLLFEVSASRTDGLKESKTFQLTEDDFERLFIAFQRVRRQLEIVKQKVV